KTKTRRLWLPLIALALPLSAQAPPAAAPPDQAKATGVTLGTAPSGAAKKAVRRTRCALTLAPNPVTGGQSFSFSVAYTPCLNAPQTEPFSFPWASMLPNFTETTVRQKIFKTSVGCVASSGENTLAPVAGAIKGTFTAKVTVRNTTTHVVICTATAQMTVN